MGLATVKWYSFSSNNLNSQTVTINSASNGIYSVYTSDVECVNVYTDNPRISAPSRPLYRHVTLEASAVLYDSAVERRELYISGFMHLQNDVHT